MVVTFLVTPTYFCKITGCNYVPLREQDRHVNVLAYEWRVQGGVGVMPSGEEFRRWAQECYRLSTQLQHPEHRSFALDLAKAWIELAERVERKAARIEAAARDEPPAAILVLPITDTTT
jgi:hypothetical protein